MALRWGDRVLETSTSTGTGAFTLAGAITGYRRFADVPSMATSDTCYYSIFAVDANGNPSGDWETGLGTYSSANTLTRTTPSASTNGGAAVNFGAGTKYVMLTPTAGFIGGLGSGGGSSSGTSFPGSPTSGDRYFRTDRGVEYYYDGTRWLSTQLFVMEFTARNTAHVVPYTASGSHYATNPWWNLYDIYIVDFSIIQYNGAITSTNYITYTLNKTDGITNTAIGSSISTQNDTSAVWVGHTQSINAVVTSAFEAFDLASVETGTASWYVTPKFTYRLVG